ncbi:MAG TPA: DUF6073 family protein [Thermoanaerobaculia bacterium]|nr:DUF6073 family protein [Thermoanaerobaculia bacterium]
MKKKSFLLILACSVLAVAVGMTVSAAPSDDSVRIASLVNEMNSLDFGKLESLPSVNVKSYALPGPSVDVMRVRLEETYTIEGIGEDTVELTGWIAVRHGASRPAPGESTVTWSTAVTDTEFVGLELRGESEVFGPVRVTLDESRPAIGQVGKISVPEHARQVLLAANDTATAAPKGDTTDSSTTDTDNADAISKCRAPVNVKVSMSQLGLEMKTKTPAVWYSEVSTIPPVGHVASVTVEPVALVSADREVGKLVSGTVKFREVVRAVPLSKNHQIAVAP